MSSARHSDKNKIASSKSQNITKNITAFFLFLVIAALSLSVCLKISFLNPVKHTEIFTNQDYVTSLYEDVKEYSYDLCLQSSIPADAVDEVITYSNVFDIEEAYAQGQTGISVEYTQTTYEDRLKEFSENLSSSLKKTVKQYSLSNEKDAEKGAKEFAQRVTSYLKNKVEFVYMDKLVTIQNLGKTISVVLIVIFAILALVLALVVFSVSDKRYRALRSISHSFIAASLLQLLFVSGVQIIKQVKSLVIYPLYLSESVMKFINSCVLSVGISAFVSFVISMVLITVVWKLKRNEK